MDIDYEILPAVVRPEDALRERAALVWDQARSSLCFQIEAGERATVDAAFASAAIGALGVEIVERGFGRYCETKLANILFTTELARRLDGTGVTANCFHPGLVATGFNRNNGLLMNLGMTILRPVARSAKKGAETLVWLATSPAVANVSGVYFFDHEQRPPSAEAQDSGATQRLGDTM